MKIALTNIESSCRLQGLYANLIWSLIECRIKTSTQGGTAHPFSSAKIRIFLQTHNINKLKIKRKIMAKKYQHWEIVFRTIEKDEWTWRNLPFHLKFEDKESAEKKYKEIVEDVVETGHVSMPGRLSDYYDNKIIEEKEYDKRDDLSRIKSTEFEITRSTDKPYNLSVELCEYDFSINYEF